MDFEADYIPNSTPQLTSLPEALQEHLASNGEHATLVANDARAIGMYRTYGYRVLLSDHLPDHLRNEILAELENPMEHHGKCVKGDAVIMVRSLAAQQKWRKHFEGEWAATRQREMQVAEQAAETMRTRSRSQTRSAKDLVDIIPEEVYPIEAHAVGGPEFAEVVRKTLKKASG